MDLLPDQKPPVATRSDTDFPGKGFSVHPAVSSVSREEIGPNSKDKRGGLNTTSPPARGSDFLEHKPSNLALFGLGLLCLLALFFVINQTANEVVLKTISTGREFLSSARTGEKLVFDAWRQTLSNSRDFMLRGFGVAVLAVKESASDANREFLSTKKTVLAGLLIWQKNLAQQPLAGRQLAHFVLPKSIMAKLATQDSQTIGASVINSELDSSAGSSSPAATPMLNKNGLAVLVGTLSWVRYIFEPTALPMVITAYNEEIQPVRQPLNNGLSLFADTGRGWGGDIASAWDNFFGLFSGGQLSQTALREQLKAEILQELKNGNSATVTAGNDSSIFEDTGIVVLKPSGGATVDIQNVKKLQQAFSDRVIVNFDQGGQTGVIQPIFRDRVGEKYLFVITPIKK